MRAYFLWLAKFITVILVIFFCVPMVIGLAVTMFSDEESRAELGLQSVSTRPRVVVLDLEGIIEDSEDLIKKLYKQINDSSTKGVILRINSPGGAVAPSQEIFSAVKKLSQKKPVVAVMGSLAASGGLYAALGASKILCQPGTMTGSIGVILQIPNIRKISERIGFEMVTIKSGKLKDVGNAFREMTAEEKEFFTDTAETVHAQFIQAVSEGRALPLEKVRTFADGRILLGEEAKTLGLVDDYGDVYDAARLVYELSGSPLKDHEQPRLDFPDDEFPEVLKGFFESGANLLGMFQSQTRLMYLVQ